MKKNLLAALLTLAFVLSGTILVRAEEPAKPEEPKAPMYSAKCKSPCDFSVKSHDKAEVAAILKAHAKSHHNMELSDADAEAMVKSPAPKK